MALSSFPSTTCWRDCLYSIGYSFLLCQRLVGHTFVGPFLGSLFCSVDLSVLVPVPYCLDDYIFVIQLEVHVFNSFGYIPRSGIAGSYCNSVFNLLRSCQIVTHSSCTILHSQEQWCGFQFPISSPILFSLFICLKNSHPMVVSHWFWFAFLWWLMILSVFTH